MTPTKRALMAALTCLLLGAGLLTATTVSAQAAHPKVALNSVGDRRVGAAIPVIGFLSGTGSKHDKTVFLQRKMADGKWHHSGRLIRRADGRFKFPDRHVFKPQTARWRAIAKSHGKVLDVSTTLAVKVLPQTCASLPSPTNCPQPPDKVQTRDVTDTPVCDPAGGGTVVIEHQTRNQPYVWNPVTLEWELGDPLEWVTVSTDTRAATEAECPAPAVHELLPDLVVKNITRCSPAEMAETGTCFRIRTVGDQRLLKFPVVTANAGLGNMEIHATRTSTADQVWSARQIITMDDGTTTQTGLPGINFFFAGDGHSHWHIRDFDSYRLFDSAGHLAEGEKHGYCLEDNTTLPGSSTEPVFTHDVVCGDGQPDALSIVHGLSPGWGDTYPSSLPDQAINITGLGDGTYTVKVCADQMGALRESNESNNCSQVDVAISGDTATPVPGTDSGF